MKMAATHPFPKSEPTAAPCRSVAVYVDNSEEIESMQIKTIDCLSGDSTVEDVFYKNGKACVIYVDYEIDQRLLIRAKTDVFYSEKNSESGSVHVRFFECKEKTPIDETSGIFIAGSDFSVQMKLCREGLNLVLGRKAKEWPYFFEVRGYGMLLACPLRSEGDIEILEYENED
jgi:hypothetical protein